MEDRLTQAMELFRSGNFPAAKAAFSALLAEGKHQPESLHFLGLIAFQQQDYPQALAQLTQAVALSPHEGTFHNSLGAVLKVMGRTADAVAHYARAAELLPQQSEIFVNLGEAYGELKQFEPAIRSLQRAYELQPHSTAIAYKLGMCHLSRREFVAAGKLMQTVLSRDPNHRDALTALGSVFYHSHQLAEAEQCCQASLLRWPDSPAALSLLVGVRIRQGRPNEAVHLAGTALQRYPEHAELHFNAAYALWMSGELSAAYSAFERAESWGMTPEYCRIARGFIDLLRGDFAAGLRGYEEGFDANLYESRQRNYSRPAWKGEPLTGKTILLWCGQGLGDAIHFVRYAPLLKQRGARVLLECLRPLRKILERTPGIDQLITSGEPLPPFDVHQSVMSLPYYFQTRLETIPRPIPYLFVDEEQIAHWRQKLQPLPGKKIGIAWQGNRRYAWDLYRSIPLAAYAPLAAVPGVTLISLQKGAGEEQIPTARQRFPFTVIDQLDETAGPLMDTAAILKNLDLFITSDCGLAHLAGAMGIKTWLILGHVPEWRWLLERDDSPWYPTLRLFRQQRGETWEPVFARLAAALRSEHAAG